MGSIMSKQIDNLLNTAFENYNFGDDVMVTDVCGWESDGSNDYIRVAYVEFDDEEGSHKVSFHVVLNDSKTEVVESYALLTESGNILGCEINKSA